MTTAQLDGRRRPTASRLLAAEVRAELARQGISKRDLAARLHTTDMWVSRRLSPSSTVQITLEDLVAMAEALGVSAEGLMLAVLPRLDSNQQPSGYRFALVRRFRGWRASRSKRVLAPVVDLAAYRAEVAS